LGLVGFLVGVCFAEKVGNGDGAKVGLREGAGVGLPMAYEGLFVGATVGGLDGTADGLGVGTNAA